MKQKPQQFEIPDVSREVFNLMVESALDGERIRMEMEAARADALLAKRLEEKQQPELLPANA
jgi:hypothetical protein